MTVYKKNEISKKYIRLGFIGAIVCEHNGDDGAMIKKLSDAFYNKKNVLIKGQQFFVGAIDVSDSYGTVLFGLKPCVQIATEGEYK